jgi:hypothetical protein
VNTYYKKGIHLTFASLVLSVVRFKCRLITMAA